VPLEFAPLEIPYGQLDTHTDPTAMEPGTLTKAENVSSDVDGHYSKRFGYETLPTVGAASGAVRLAKRGTQLLAYDNRTQWKYSADLGTWTQWSLSAPCAKPSEKIIALEQSSSYKKCTRATANGLALHAWVDSSTGFVTVHIFSEADGSLLTGYTDTSNDYEILHAVSLGDVLVIAYSSATSQLIRYRTYDTTTFTFGTLTTWPLITVFAGTVGYPYAPFDIVAVSSTDICMAWATDVPEIHVIRRNVVAHTDTTAAVVLSTEEPDGGFAIATASASLGLVAFHSATASAVRTRGFNPTTSAAVFALATVEADGVGTGSNFNIGIVAESVTSFIVAFDRHKTAPAIGSTRTYTVSSTGIVAFDTLNYNYWLAAKPYTYLGRCFLPILAPLETQDTYFTVDITSGAVGSREPVAMHGYRTAFHEGAGVACLSDTDVISAGVYAFDAPIAYKFLTVSSTTAAVSTFYADYTDPLRFLPAEMGDSVYFTGGVTFKFEGRYVSENNFLLYPEIQSATVGSVGGAGMDNGLYSYIVVFEVSDQSGNIDRSTTSLPMAATTSAGAGLGKVDLVIRSLNVSHRIFTDQRVKASIFRTEAGGETYYFVGSVVVGRQFETVAYTDSANDSTIISNRIIYTQGGILDREPAPPCEQLVVHNNRMWGFTQKTVFYSGDYVPGENPWFSTAQRFIIEQGGDITALASLDEKLIIFKRDRIFKVTGRGANVSGSGSDLTPPDVITADCGCIDPRSVIVIPQGVMFQGDKGIYMLSRGEELTYIGMPVSLYTDTYPIVNAATMMPKIREVRFQVSDGDDEGAVLVYNYRDNRWTTHTNYDYGPGVSTPGDPVSVTDRVDAIVIDGVYHTLDSLVFVSAETEAYRDPDDTYIVSEIETGWIKPAGKQGLVRVQRVLFLNEFVEEHDMEFEMDKDYVDTSVQSAQYAAADIASLPQEQVSLHVQNQQGEAWRFRMRDAESSAGESQGYKARGVTLTVGVKRGTFEKVMQAGAKA
jgi:hypothetical protein